MAIQWDFNRNIYSPRLLHFVRNDGQRNLDCFTSFAKILVIARRSRGDPERNQKKIYIILDCFTSFAMTGFLLLIAKQPLCGHCFTVFAMTLSYREVEAWRSGYSNYPLYNLQKFSSTCAQSCSSLIPNVSAANFPTILTFAGLLIWPRKPCGER